MTGHYRWPLTERGERVETTADAIERAQHLVTTGRYAEALPVLRGHDTAYPADAQACHWLAGALTGTGDWPAAIEAASRSLAVEPDNPVAYLMRALAHLSLRQYADLRDDAAQAVRLRPDDVEALTLLAQGLLKTDGDSESRALAVAGVWGPALAATIGYRRQVRPAHRPTALISAAVGAVGAGAWMGIVVSDARQAWTVVAFGLAAAGIVALLSLSGSLRMRPLRAHDRSGRDA